MSPLMLSVWIMVATFAVLATGIPIAFAVALVSTVFFLAIEGFGRVWSEATLRETLSGTKALDQYYHRLASRNRARVHVAYVCEQ